MWHLSTNWNFPKEIRDAVGLALEPLLEKENVITIINLGGVSAYTKLKNAFTKAEAHSWSVSTGGGTRIIV